MSTDSTTIKRTTERLINASKEIDLKVKGGKKVKYTSYFVTKLQDKVIKERLLIDPLKI
jgi:hypothetical protein